MNIIIYQTEDGKSSVGLFAEHSNVWLSQNQLSELFATSVSNISMHIANIINDKELQRNSVIKDYLTTASDGKQYNVTHYSLEMILAIGFRGRSKRGTQFRQWATQNLREYMIKGFLVDDERLKNPDGRPDYFDEMLERIREVRASEKRFYQKVRDLFALSSDYDKSDKSTQMFFAETQNKLLFAVCGKTASELILSRADAKSLNMGLSSWKGNIIRKQDIIIAKNYLQEDEIDSLNRLVVLFLEDAELRIKRRQDITMSYWNTNVDRILEFQDFEILKNAGSISKKQMESEVNKIYADFNQKRKQIDSQKANQEDFKQLEELEKKLNKSL